MPRNFGVKRSLFGVREMAEDFWNDPHGEPNHSPRWPYAAIGVAVVAIITIALFAH